MHHIEKNGGILCAYRIFSIRDFVCSRGHGVSVASCDSLMQFSVTLQYRFLVVNFLISNISFFLYKIILLFVFIGTGVRENRKQSKVLTLPSPITNIANAVSHYPGVLLISST